MCFTFIFTSYSSVLPSPHFPQVNPATSFADSPWPQLGPALTALPAQLYNALPIALSPILTNPFSIAMNGVDRAAPLQRQVGLMGVWEGLTSDQ